jgi:hypothetical protein
MKNTETRVPLLVGAIIGLLYFFPTKNGMQILGVEIYFLFGFCSFFASLVLAISQTFRPAKLSLWLALGAELSIVTSIFIDIVKDSGSHNLFPFEILGTFSVIFSCAFIGEFLGLLIKGLIKKLK